MVLTVFDDLVSAAVEYLPGVYPNAPKRNTIVLLFYLLVVLLAAGGVQFLVGAVL